MKLILGSKESINSKNKDYQLSFDLENNQMLFDETLITKIIDESVQFQKERDTSTNYLLYGKVESIIDEGLVSEDYSLNTNNYDISVGYIGYYEPTPESIINIKNRIGDTITITEKSNVLKGDIVLLYKSNDDIIFTKVIDKISKKGQDMTLVLDYTGSTIGYNIIPAVANYKRIFVPLHTTNFIKFYNSGFSTNIFSEKIWQYNTFKNINLGGLKDNFGLPITEVVFNFRHKTSYNVTSYKKGKNGTSPTVIDIISFDLNNMEFKIVDYTINKFMTGIDVNSPLFQAGTEYYYKPFHIIKHKYFSSVVTEATKETIFQYPEYAKLFNNGDVFFKKLLPIGYIEEGVNGADYPFINNLHYLYSDIKFPVRRIIPIANYTILPLIEDLEFIEGVISIDKGGRIC